MEIFGIGPLELVLIVVVAIIVLGPKEMITTAQKAATWLGKLRKSDIWATTKDVMDIPNKVMKETGLDKEIREIQNLSQKTFSPSAWQPDSISHSSSVVNNPDVLSDGLPQTPAVGDESKENDEKTDQTLEG